MNLLKEFEEHVKEFVESEKEGMEEVHKLRIKSRELFSLLDKKHLFHSQLKKIIKLSNDIRDMDVFFYEYLDSLPPKYIKKLDLKSIEEPIRKKRAKRISSLHLYLRSLEIPQNIKFIQKESKVPFVDSSSLMSPNDTLLHKYRIFIKHNLYREKNLFPVNKKAVKTLTKIKDILGEIHDNINALEMLEGLKIDDRLLKKIRRFTKNKNIKLFVKFKKLNDKYIRNIS